MVQTHFWDEGIIFSFFFFLLSFAKNWILKIALRITPYIYLKVFSHTEIRNTFLFTTLFPPILTYTPYVSPVKKIMRGFKFKSSFHMFSIIFRYILYSIIIFCSATLRNEKYFSKRYKENDPDLEEWNNTFILCKIRN